MLRDACAGLGGAGLGTLITLIIIFILRIMERGSA